MTANRPANDDTRAVQKQGTGPTASQTVENVLTAESTLVIISVADLIFQN